MHVLYYITAHGYGHGVRSCTIINSIPSIVGVTIRTALPLAFFNEELHRPFSFRTGKFDCGCVQIDGVTVDVEKTLSMYQKIADINRTTLDDEANWCRENNVSCIIADSTPFALDVAKKAAIPSIVLSNFTWYDIYKEYVFDGHSFIPYLDEIKCQYRSADLLLSLSPANPMEYMERRVEIPVIGRVGKNRRDEIAKMYSFDKSKKTGLIYIGEYGMQHTQWTRLATLTDWEFLSLYSVEEYPSNFHLVNKERLIYQDLTASVDVVISKPGYGVVSECFLNGVPLLYVPRTDFAEYPVIVDALEKWGGSCLIPEYEFYAINWKPYLDLILKQGKPSKVESDGIKLCIDAIMNIMYR